MQQEKAIQASKDLCPRMISLSDRLNWKEGFMRGAGGHESLNYGFSPAADGYQAGKKWRQEQEKSVN